MRLLEQYNDNPEKIDYTYYIEKALMNPINQLFEVGFKDTIEKLQYIYYKPNSRSKEIRLDRPVLMILRMIQNKFNFHEVKTQIKNNLERMSTKPQVVINIVRDEPQKMIPSLKMPKITNKQKVSSPPQNTIQPNKVVLTVIE